MYLTKVKMLDIFYSRTLQLIANLLAEDFLAFDRKHKQYD